MKAKYWTCIIYPDSLPENYLEIIEDSLLSCALSPLHNKDLTKAGDEKKAHYHLVIAFTNTTTYNNVLSFTKLLNATIPKKVMNIGAIFEYLTHQNNANKYHYSKSEIKLINGFDISKYAVTDDIRNYLLTLLNYIKNNNVTSFKSLVSYVISTNDLDLLDALSKNSYFINCYIKDLYYYSNN